VGSMETSGNPPFGRSLAPETGRDYERLDTFARLELARQAKADHTLVFRYPKTSVAPVSSDPLH
jgi:hypothetical protein